MKSQETDYVQIEVTCRHGSINDYAHAHITEKSKKLLTFFERVTAIHVTIDFEHGKAKSEILVDAEHKHNFVSSAVEDDVITSFDNACHKMEQQIKKYKEKIQDHRRDVPVNEAFPDPLAIEENTPRADKE
jgi:ribosome hibernation promoting factor